MNLNNWRPSAFFAALRAIDEEANNSNTSIDYRKPAIVLLTMALCLLLIHYMKYASTFNSVIYELSRLMYGNPSFYLQIKNSQWAELYGHTWWAVWHLIGYVLIPCLIIRIVLREPLQEYGVGLGKTKAYAGYYAALATPIVFFAFLVSFREDFANHYPFYKLASRSLLDLLLWELLYISQFIALEFFFRGFVLHACRPQFGASAVFVMTVPYLMIHFQKPWLEATGAIPFGILLGVLALRSRSIWGGAAVHVTIALSMDLLALMQAGLIPSRWIP